MGLAVLRRERKHGRPGWPVTSRMVSDSQGLHVGSISWTPQSIPTTHVPLVDPGRKKKKKNQQALQVRESVLLVTNEHSAYSSR